MQTNTPPPAAALLAAFLEKYGVKQAEAAIMLNVSKAVFSGWLSGRTQPRAEWRLVIARWTRNTVPADAWLTDADRDAINNVIPLRRRVTPAASKARAA